MEKKLPDEPDNDEEEDEREEVEAAVPYVTLIRKCDCTINIIICKLPHKMDCSNKSLVSDKKAVSKSAYQKRYYAENREGILAQQKQWRAENAEIIKARLQTKREQINRWRRAYRQKNKERISGYRRKYRENNRERINERWRQYYAKNKGRINHRKKKIEKERNGTRAQGPENVQVETSLVPAGHVIMLTPSEGGIPTFTSGHLSNLVAMAIYGDVRSDQGNNPLEKN